MGPYRTNRPVPGITGVSPRTAQLVSRARGARPAQAVKPSLLTEPLVHMRLRSVDLYHSYW